MLIDGDVGHPLGSARGRDGWIVSTVFPDSGRGEVVESAAAGCGARAGEELELRRTEQFVDEGRELLRRQIAGDATGHLAVVVDHQPRREGDDGE